MIFAVVPAAGHSTRMGRPKLTLMLDGRTVLERVVAALHGGGVEHVVVVTGPETPELNSQFMAFGAAVCCMSESTPDMRSTVEHGLRWLEKHHGPAPDDAFLLVPADHPLFSHEVVRSLCDAVRISSEKSIFVPVHAGQRGHPALIGWRHVARIRALPSDLGINAYLRANIVETLEVDVADAGILVDLDTPEDYERLCSRPFLADSAMKSIPTRPST